jgi:hypothetical protein
MSSNTMDTVKNQLTSTVGNVTDFMTKTTGVTKGTLMDYMGIFITIIIALITLIYVYNKLNLDNKNCQNMSYQYKEMPPIKSFNEESGGDMFAYKLRDYYIKTAYNACCAGGFKNDFVNLCALKQCIRQGARCIDLEVYSLDDKPVIATSSVDDFSIKETYNSIPFPAVMGVISDYAFSGSTCPCPGDPLILHLRIMSNNAKIYDEMARDLHTKLERRLLGPEYSYENNQRNISEEPLSNFKGKVIIVVDKSNPLYESTPLDEYVNLASNSIFMRKVRFSYGIKFAQDTAEIAEYNKKNMTICLPDLTTTPTNYAVSIPMKYGCQMVALSFQNYDENMKFYEKFFNGVGYAFALKPEHLRFKSVTITVPAPADPKVSYATRQVNKPYVSYKI